MGAIYETNYRLARFVARTLFGFRVVHPERILESGGVIFASNHESFLDPPLAGISCERQIFYLARRTLLNIPVLGRLLPHLNVIPVDQVRADMSALKTVIRLVKAGEATVIFPEGTRSVDGCLRAAQPGLGMVIAKTRAPVVPMRIFGAHRAFPKGGIPRLFTPVTLVVGEPMYFGEGDFEGREGRELYQHLSDRVMERIGAIEMEGV